MGNGAELWFQIDFGAPTTISSAELAFFADKTQGFDVPEAYRVQVATGHSWIDVSDAKNAKPVANGITDVKWKEAQSNKVRLVFTPKSGVKVRFVEFKVF